MRNHTGGPRPIINVPLTVVASRAVGFAMSGRMPMTASTMMITRPALRCLQDTVSCHNLGLVIIANCIRAGKFDNNGWTLFYMHILQHPHVASLSCITNPWCFASSAWVICIASHRFIESCACVRTQDIQLQTDTPPMLLQSNL